MLAARVSPRGRSATSWPLFPPCVQHASVLAQGIGRDPYEIEWSVGVEPGDIERFVNEDAGRYLAPDFHALHARIQRPGVARRSRDTIPRVARPHERPASRVRSEV